MGVTEKAFDKIVSWGLRKGLKGIDDKIRKIIKAKRLVFLGEDKVLYIDKYGVKRELTFGKAVSEFISAGGWADQMATLGITHQDVKDILKREYEKQRGGK